MIILYEEHFKKSLKNIVLHISKDKKSAAIEFKNNLLISINKIITNPKMYRKSFYSDDENYRDLIFMGYTVTYKIDSEVIKILDIFKWQDK